jgi:hypothetical protein
MALVEWIWNPILLVLSLATGRLGGVEDHIVGSANARLRDEAEG